MTFITDAEIGKAAHVISIKTCGQIEKETAIRWGAMALAALSNAKNASIKKDKNHWMALAVNFAHEAIEHAAGAEKDYPGIVAKIISELEEIP